MASGQFPVLITQQGHSPIAFYPTYYGCNMQDYTKSNSLSDTSGLRNYLTLCIIPRFLQLNENTILLY